ncbi:hypothetical protein DTG75_04930 [Salmonella enterica subsp. salamae]|nr:hypothetical protein LFZ47_13135 [Salmonella enterica subsp. salamae serovar 55:k:z39 str. 1315K]ECC1479248.1 siphovirus Gp157 family protein [Salmonella enterica subsp. salamae]EEL7717197.1 hypothetical protein [Salmonella enterica]ECC1656216.1 siphovirus Gp157 family protein [Salmonella enterica subsp. salamae]ECD9414248.1 siphovirus Gp157 family protein [Salmonella enterica subsp. salamae]
MSKLLALVESGEFSPGDVADTLEGEELALADKFDGIMALVRNLEGQASIVAGEVKRLSERKKSFDTQAKNLRTYILLCLQAAQVKNFKTDRNTLTIRHGAINVVVDNADLLPDELVNIETVTTPDKRKIKEAIEAGVEVEGAHLEPGAVTLQVR